MKFVYTFAVAVSIAVGAYIFGAFGAAISCSASKREDNKIPLTVLMYHNITKEPSMRGKYNIYIREFEDDLKYMSRNGYSPISVKQLADYAYNGTPLPDMPVIITFDDGFESFYEYAFPLLEKYGFKAVVNTIGSCAEKYTQLEAQHNPDCHNLNYSYLNIEELKALKESGIVEIGCHTYDMHNLKGERRGAGMKKGESTQHYKAALEEDLKKYNAALNEVGGTDIFAHPYGIYCADTLAILRQNGFRAVFDCTERINYINRKNIDWMFYIHRFNRPSGISSECFFARLQ